MWEIDIEASSPVDAAERAEEYQGVPGSRVHTVIDEDAEVHQVDLDNTNE